MLNFYLPIFSLEVYESGEAASSVALSLFAENHSGKFIFLGSSTLLIGKLCDSFKANVCDELRWENLRGNILTTKVNQQRSATTFTLELPKFNSRQESFYLC